MKVRDSHPMSARNNEPQGEERGSSAGSGYPLR